MKQILSLSLALLPCLAWAQYPSNGNQKITLGEQTTADGLVWRGVANDTNVITPFSDTSAYIILDTVNSKFYHYNRTTTFWALAGGGGDSGGVTSFSAGTTGLTPSTATTGAVTLGGTLAVANGGTGSATKNFVDLTTTQSSIAGKKTFTTGIATTANVDGDPEAFTLSNTSTGTSAESTLYVRNESNNNASIFFQTVGTNFTSVGGFLNDQGTIGTGTALSNGMAIMVRAAADMRFYTSGHTNERMRITSTGNVGIGTASPQSGYRLHVVDSVYVGGNVSASAYTTRSDYDLKDEIQNISYGINEVMQMQPVKYTYKSNGSTQLGFIAQDLGVITPEVVSFEDKMSVYYNALIPILTKAIQEQQALIKALEQRILILENK